MSDRDELIDRLYRSHKAAAASIAEFGVPDGEREDAVDRARAALDALGPDPECEPVPRSSPRENSATPDPDRQEPGLTPEEFGAILDGRSPRLIPLYIPPTLYCAMCGKTAEEHDTPDDDAHGPWRPRASVAAADARSADLGKIEAAINEALHHAYNTPDGGQPNARAVSAKNRAMALVRSLSSRGDHEKHGVGAASPATTKE